MTSGRTYSRLKDFGVYIIAQFLQCYIVFKADTKYCYFKFISCRDFYLIIQLKP